MKKSRLARRDVEVFSLLSFLDAICCGFGAVILLLVLTEVGEPVVIEKSRVDLEGRVLKMRGTGADPRRDRSAGTASQRRAACSSPRSS